MKWDESQASGNVEDRRGMKAGPLAAGGGILSLIIAAGAYFILGLNPQQAQQLGQAVGGQVNKGAAQGENKEAPDDRVRKFAKTMIGFNDEVWKVELPKQGFKYVNAKGVIFDQAQVQSGCGMAPSAAGPFYCPADKTLYYNPAFFVELEQKLGGSAADFSQAYVIAHEIGHHVQNLNGYSARVDAKRGSRQENDYSVRLELQADYIAGAWAYHAHKRFQILERGDVEAALKSADAIGDDRLQSRNGSFARPESFTHGTSAQRKKWFKKGYDTGDVSKKALDVFFDAGSSQEL